MHRGKRKNHSGDVAGVSDADKRDRQLQKETAGPCLAKLPQRVVDSAQTYHSHKEKESNVEDSDDESDSDKEKIDPDFSSMTQPTLIKQLQGILAEYPDGGQIIKELIQNAEDAGASEVKILFDGRRVNRETKQNMIYSKFFQSPSICVYNDASFTQTDWEGIRMIYSSVKEKDRLKVGRFGLGFKSVFHITDYPCILSGDQVLLIDPQQEIDNRVNAMMKLSKLDRYKGIGIKAFLKALDGTFGINEDILKKGHYAGTLFWFPLRESPSTLSETLYDEQKVMALFESFRTDASTILLFLRSISRISLYNRTSGNPITDIARVEIVDNGDEIQKKRVSFQEEIKEISAQEYTGDPKYISYTMTVQSKNCIFGNPNDKMDTIENKCQKWQVVNYFIGQNASPAFQSLIRDPALGYIPFVGVAAPLDTACDTLAGHVFCFLPLPKEGSRLTGLPVHVNGYFALSQNRHHLRWATEDQKLTDIHDKAILWNEKLVSECLPQAYGTLIQELVEQSEQAGNSEESVAMVYRAIPDLKQVEGKWEHMLPAIFQIQKNKSFFFTANAQTSGKGDWITIEEARFALLKNSPTNEKNAIVNALGLCKEKYVEIPLYVFETLKHFYSCVNDLSPGKMCSVLQQNDNYKRMAHEMKLALASYILSDNDYRKVNGLELLPLASGSWTRFEDKQKTVYICSDLEMALFPGCEDRIVMKHVKLAKHFEDMARQGFSQVRKMTIDESRKLIKEILVQYFGEKGPRIMTFETKTDLTIAWQRSIWKYLAKQSAVSTFENVSVLPLLRRGTWENPLEVELVCLTELIALQEAEGESFPKEVYLCLEALSVKVLPSLPHWIHMSEIDKYVEIPSHSFVIKLFARLFEMSNVSEIIESFNRSCQPACREALLQFLGDCSGVQNNGKELLKRLKLFKEKRSPNSDTKLVSLCENKYFTNVSNFPVRYPMPFLDVGMVPERLQRSLDIEKIRLDDLILKTLKSIQHSNYTEDEVMTFMDYLIANWHNVKKKEEIIQTARPIPFLRTSVGLRKPSDLFNPLDSTLQDLLFGEHCFPVAKVDNDKTVTILRDLGLKFIEDLNADNLITTAKVLDTWSRQNKKDLHVNKKAVAFLKVLNRFPDLLEQTCQDKTLLKHNLVNLHCITYDSETHRYFPKCLPLFSPKKTLFKPDEVRDSRKSHIVGSTMPIVHYETERVSKPFGWNDDPPIEKVLEQLEIITKTYNIRHKPDILIVLKDIYQQMNKHRDIDVELVAGRALIWNGEGFSDPAVMITCEAELEDLDLKPHFYAIPEEFRDFHQLFRNLGCKTGQNVDVLVETLLCIQKKHIESGRQHMRIVQRDIALILLILDKLADKRSDITEHSILVPIQTDDNCVLVMKPASQCTYDRKSAHYDSDDDEDPVYFIHERVSVKTAKALGILSLRMKNLDETDEFEVENWGQEEPLTTRLKRLLEDSYMDGFTVIKELVQNADDACATAVKFLYDERENNDAMKHLLCNSMKSCQGPSLWSFNNARFTNEDLENITKLNGATKEQDAKTIGKFGLGFCSVYNLTDVPSFVSGTNVVFFDPHTLYLAEALSGPKPGLKIDMNRPKNKKLLNTHKDQFKPYLGVFGCDLSISELDGTLFRLPLRTHEQAKSSKISSLVYTKKEMQRLLRIFMKSVGNLFLFTQNIQEIEIYHLSSNSSLSRQTLLLSAKKKSFRLNVDRFLPVTESVLSKITVNTPICGDDFNEVQKIQVDICVRDNAKRVVPGIDKLPNNNVSTWIVSWAFGTSESRDMFVKSERKGVLPLAAIAVPCSKTNTLLPIALKRCERGFYKKGRMFCYLPLPLETKLQMHISACFDVTSNRRSLLERTLDDKSPGNNPWNDALMRDPLVTAFLHLLLTLSKNEIVSSVHYQYSLLWPTECLDIVGTFRKRFFSRIVKENLPVFRSVENDWVPFDNIDLLDPQVRQNRDIGQIAYDMLRRCPARQGTVMVDMSSAILSAIVDSIDKETAERVTEKSIGEIEVLLIFLRNLSDSFWNSDIKARNTMVLHALRSDSERLKDVLKETNCIPTDVKHKLRKPSELVHPTCRLTAMFLPSDGRFPIIDTNFNDPHVLQKLVELGMMTTVLPDNILLERCNSIVELGKKCCECAYKRCSNVLRYIKKCGLQTILARDADTLNVIKDAYLLPVLSRPHNWKFAWKSETCVSLKRFKNKGCDRPNHKLRTSLVIGQPAKLFFQHAADFLGSVESMIDEDGLACQGGSNILRILGVQGVDVNGIPVKKTVDQVIEISNEYQGQTDKYNEVKRIYELIFNHLHSMLEENRLDSQTIQYIKVLCEKPVILIGKELVLPQTVAFSLKEECVPQLQRLPSAEILSKRMFYTTVGVREYFSSTYILDILKQKRDKWRMNKCKEIDLIKSILINLVDSMKRDKITYKEMVNVHDCIVAPDVSSVLRPTNELVIDNEEYETSDAMKIIHGCIAPELAKAIGAKLKKKWCLEDIQIKLKCQPFGQKETLVTRLKGLLDMYPCDANVLKELLQNADDAYATEVHFIKDYRQHPTRKLIDEPFNELQGPALCVFNNSYFKQDDFRGIQHLGEGSKRDDPTKTGQYGVGFNVVYHLTDVPTFLTKGPELGNGGTLCVFDPLLKCVPDSTEPGALFDVDGVKKYFPDTLSGFMLNESLFTSETGTLFRCPLRKQSSDISKAILSTCDIDNLLAESKIEMFAALLFLKSVNCIKISNVTSGRVKEEYSITAHVSEEDKRKREHFYQETKNIVTGKQNYLLVDPIEVGYEMTISDNIGLRRKWFVVQRFGFDNAKHCLDYTTQEIAMISLRHQPLGGVAMPLPVVGRQLSKQSLEISKIKYSRKTEKCKTTTEDQAAHRKSNSYQYDQEQHDIFNAYCILPLPEKTGFPLHVNGHFVLQHDARREIEKERNGKQWNTCIAKGVIAPAWISAVKYLKNYLMSTLVETMASKSSLNDKMDRYHAMFPSWENAVDDFWKELVRQFYETVLRDELSLFPVITLVKNVASPQIDDCQYNVCWTPVGRSNSMSHGVFNELGKHSIALQEKTDVLAEILSDIGMKILQTPNSVLETLRSIGETEINTSSPGFVLHFLKSFGGSSTSSCNIGGINTPINKTRLQNVTKLQVLLKYIMLAKGEFYANVEGLPILLTNDEVLKQCSTTALIYHTRYWRMFPKSCSSCLHRDLLDMFGDKRLFDKGILTKVDIHACFKLLSESYDITLFGQSKIIPWNKDIISIEILCEVFSFLIEESLKYEKHTGELELIQSHFQSNLLKFGQWSLFPSKLHQRRQTKHELVPFAQPHILYYGWPVDKELSATLDKISLPAVDLESLKLCKYYKKLVEAFRFVFASADTPSVLLKCLSHHKRQLTMCGLTCIDGLELLSFFSRHIDTLRNETAALRSLPLFVTQQKTMTSIEDNKTVIVIPTGMPRDGIERWAELTGVIFLERSSFLEKLYNCLQLSTGSILHAYAKVLSSIQNLPQECWLPHIRYVNDYLLSLSDSQHDADRQSVINTLKDIAFINVNGQMKRASEFYCKRNPLFKCMLDKTHFLPLEFKKEKWRILLEKLGLNVIPSDKMIIAFAQQVERAGQNRLTSEVTKKANTLVDYILKNSCTNKTLNELKTIRFVLPHTVSSALSKIFSQETDGYPLISFEESISSSHENLCWTNMKLLPSSAYPNLSNLRIQLGIYESIPVQNFVKHCQNICGNTKQLLRTEFVTKLFEQIYDFLNAHSRKDETISQKLEHTPFVHLEQEGQIVKTKDVVITLSQDEEVKPYLFRAPIYYGKFHELFVRLGSAKHASCAHYAAILNAMKNKVGDKEILVSELAIMKKTLTNLFRILEQPVDIPVVIDSLCLPNRQHVLVNSTSLTVANNGEIEKRLDKKVNINYFLGFHEMELLHVMDPALPIKKLPLNVQPSLLTDIVTEEVDLKDVAMINCKVARSVEWFLHSTHLLQGILRLLKHQLTLSNRELTEKQIENVTSCLKMVKVLRVTGLKTSLYLRKSKVTGTEKLKSCFIKEGNKAYTLYFQVTGETLKCVMQSIIDADGGLIDLIDKCTCNFIEKLTLKNLPAVLMMIENPQRIKETLDDKKIDAFDLPQAIQETAFPKPGTHVEEKFHPFLEQSITLFSEDEYRSVALELTDVYIDTEKAVQEGPVFIYVHIIRQISQENGSVVLQQYEIDTGDCLIASSIVPIYRLYRFVRPDADVSTVVQKYDDEPAGAVAFDENCLRIRSMLKDIWRLSDIERRRVIRRLLLKWHPDRNIGNEDYSTRVFDYVNDVTSRLEKREDVPLTEKVSYTTSRSVPSSSSAYHHMSSQINTIAQAYRDNIVSYNHQYRTGNYIHIASGSIKRPDVGEAIQWLRLAKNDYRCAVKFNDVAAEVDGYSWICYSCHQACEKALKAACFSKDARVNDLRKSHSLTTIAKDLTPEMLSEARKLETQLREHTRMRYPDPVTRDKIPADVYKKEDADLSLEVTKVIIELADEYIQ